MVTGDILLRGNPAMDQHPIQGGVAILLGMLHAKETGITSGRLGLWLVCVFTFSYRVRGVSLIKLTYFDSCLVFFDFDILSLIKEKNIFGFSVSF